MLEMLRPYWFPVARVRKITTLDERANIIALRCFRPAGLKLTLDT